MAVYRALLAAAGIVVFLAAALAAPGAEAVIAEVGTALDSGNAAQALRLASAALSEEGMTPLQRGRLLFDSGLSQELLGSYDDAMVDFTAAIETHALPPEERAQALLQRGFMLDRLNRLEDAAKDYSGVIMLKTAAIATALNNRANVYRRQNRLQEARRDYLAALGAGAPKPQYPYYGLGQIAEAQQDKDGARQFYAKAVAADPDYLLAVQRLAELDGLPEATLAEPDVINLHLPVEKSITLHPPTAQGRAPPRPHGRSFQSVELDLHPALDGPGAKGPEVQLGAWRSEVEAQAGWDKARSRAGALLYSYVAHIVRAEVPGRGVYFRLRVRASDPLGLCAGLRTVGLDCMRV